MYQDTAFPLYVHPAKSVSLKSVFHRICVTISFCTESQSMFGSSYIPTDVFGIRWSSLVIFLGGDGGYEHPPPPPRNQELQLRRRRTHTIVWWVVQAAAMDDSTTAAAVVVTIVIRHKKTWARIVPVQNNVSLVHDDGFYPHRDVTTM
jgi:hypothetical protein